MNLAYKFLITIYIKANRRSLYMTKKGYLYLALLDAKVRDSLYILLGNRVLYIL